MTLEKSLSFLLKVKEFYGSPWADAAKPYATLYTCTLVAACVFLGICNSIYNIELVPLNVVNELVCISVSVITVKVV